MKVKVVVTFKDIREKKLRKEGETFECTEERYEEILKKGKLVEPVEEEKPEAEPEEPAEEEKPEVAPVQPEKKATASRKKAKEEKDGNL